jgi:hypothetical protein
MSINLAIPFLELSLAISLLDLMPRVLLSSEFEHILMWRGRDLKSSLIESNGDD